MRSVHAAAWTWAMLTFQVVTMAAPPRVAVSNLSTVSDNDPVLAELVPPDPSDPANRQVLENNRKRFEAEKALRKFRLTYFSHKNDALRRREGFEAIRTYTDPATFPALLAAFERDDEEVRLTVLDHLANQHSEPGRINLAYAAIYDADEAMRNAAAERLRASDPDAHASHGVQSLIAACLRHPETTSAARAAILAQRLGMYEAIPALINAQFSGSSSSGSTGGGASGNGDGYRAYIVVGQQVSFVSDLTPVVGSGAVGFDPTVSVITEGSVLAVKDAFVTVYPGLLYAPLAALAREGWGGGSVEHLGADRGKWIEWYNNEFLPHRAAEQAAAARGG